MKSIFHSLCISFSMYSVFPVPKADWDRVNMKYVMVFFPLVGVVIGAFVSLFARFAPSLGISSLLASALMAFLPIFLSGGIHMDGFIDTMDALGSNGDAEKRLKILKDPNSGAFGVLGAVLYALLFFAVFFEYLQKGGHFAAFPLIFALSRSASAVLVVKGKAARNSGLLHLFGSSADKKFSLFGIVLVTAAVLAFGAVFEPVFTLISAIFTAVFTAIYYVRMTKLFSGLTGDLTGALTSVLELCLVLILAVFEV